ncbi:MAG: hypothetical protein IPN40_09195 [Uliginosibacterium sp.]|nr:hypothetical protein [Uliginosibacterium sp.]
MPHRACQLDQDHEGQIPARDQDTEQAAPKPIVMPSANVLRRSAALQGVRPRLSPQRAGETQPGDRQAREQQGAGSGHRPRAAAQKAGGEQARTGHQPAQDERLQPDPAGQGQPARHGHELQQGTQHDRDQPAQGEEMDGLECGGMPARQQGLGLRGQQQAGRQHAERAAQHVGE